VVVDELSVN
jgi:protein-tyrosine phosphatase